MHIYYVHYINAAHILSYLVQYHKKNLNLIYICVGRYLYYLSAF